MTYGDPIELTKKLVSLPSYVRGSEDETPVTDFLGDFLRAELPEMQLERQFLDGSSRCNLILRGKGEPHLLVLGHVDTVLPKEDWDTPPLEPVVIDSTLFGLGVADMKGSLAAFLSALIAQKKELSLDKLFVLMYVDEEYDFKGIRRFLADPAVSNLRPTLTLSLDGELAVASGCRGLIELHIKTRGKSGHAANPKNGVNAIIETVDALHEVSGDLITHDDVDLGPTTTNVAYLRGGVLLESGDDISWSQEGNVIPDTAQAVFEIRPSSPVVNAELVIEKIRRALAKRHVELGEALVRHDIAPWPSSREEQSLELLRRVYFSAGVPFEIGDRKLQGYIDAQMVTEIIPVPTFIVGTGGENKHGANENVGLAEIVKATRIYGELLREMLGES